MFLAYITGRMTMLRSELRNIGCLDEDQMRLSYCGCGGEWQEEDLDLIRC